jgi:hypothetical protein
VSYKSQRVDILAALPGMLDAELIAGKRSYTVGIEGISRRMRVFLHKSLSDSEINSLISRLFQLKVREIKLFFILTGHETVADIAEFRQFLRFLKSMRTGRQKGIRVVFSFGLLIRMPFTPLRYDRLYLEEEEWKELIGKVKSACETNGFEFRLAIPWQDYATSQVMALGRYWLWQPLLMLAEQGFCYDTQLEQDYWHSLKFWMQEHEYWTEEFLGEKDAETVFPLEFVEQRVSDEFLYLQYLKAKEGVDDGYCLGEIGQQGVESSLARCLGCGACTSFEERSAITGHKMVQPDGTYLRELTNVIDSKRRIKPGYCLLWLPPDTAGKNPEWLNAWVMRAFFQAMPNQVENIIAIKESLFSTKVNSRRYAGLYGQTVFSIYAWDLKALAEDMVLQSKRLTGIRFINWLDSYSPGEFQRAVFTMQLPANHFPKAGHQLRRYLQAQYVPVNLRRTPEGYAFDISKKALQKRVIFSGSFTQDEVAFLGEFTVSSKFNVRDFLQSFAEPYWIDEAIIEVKNLEL